MASPRSLLLEEDFEEEVDTATLPEAELKDYVRQEAKPRVSVMKLIMKSILLDFSSFPFKVVFFPVVLNSPSHGHNNAVSIALPTTTKSHTAVNIESWLPGELEWRHYGEVWSPVGRLPPHGAFLSVAPHSVALHCLRCVEMRAFLRIKLRCIALH